MAFPRTTVVPIQFSGGLNSKVSGFTLDQPYLTKCENGVFNLSGQIDKRTGFTSISTDIQGGGNISAGAALSTFNGELLLMDGKGVYSYQTETQTWISRGALFSTINDQIRILNTKVATQSNPDVTTANGVSLYVWEDNRRLPLKSDGIRFTLYNNLTGTIILSDQQLYIAGSRPKVITDGTVFTVYYNASANNILSATIPVAAPSTVTSNLVEVCADGQPTTPFTQSIPYDVCLFNGAPLIAYASQSGLKLGTQVISANVALQTIATCVDSLGHVWVIYSDATNTYVSAYSYAASTFTPLFTPFAINALNPIPSANIAVIAGQQAGNVNLTLEVTQAGDANVNNNFCNNYSVTPNGSATFIGQMRGVGLASKPFAHNGEIFINTVAQSNLQSTYFTQCLTFGQSYVPGTVNIQAANNAALATNFLLVAKHSPQNGGGYRTNSLLSQADPISPGKFGFAGQRKGPFTTWSNAADVNLGCAGYTVDFESLNAFNSVQSNNNLHIVGGIKKIYDGISCVEDNFCLFPENYLGFGADCHARYGPRWAAHQ